MVSESGALRARRDCLAAAAMAFAPATDVPRKRALLRSGLFSLLHNYGENTFEQSEAISVISGHGNLPEIRPSVAREVLDMLIKDGVVREAVEGDNPLYKFDTKFLEKCQTEQQQVETLVIKVIDDLFGEVNKTNDEKKECLDEMLVSIARVMERFGKQYAYELTGRSEGGTGATRADIIRACEEALGRRSGAIITPDAMADALAELFARKEPHFAAFVFALTQSYFYMRLTGLAGGLVHCPGYISE